MKFALLHRGCQCFKRKKSLSPLAILLIFILEIRFEEKFSLNKSGFFVENRVKKEFFVEKND